MKYFIFSFLLLLCFASVCFAQIRRSYFVKTPPLVAGSFTQTIYTTTLSSFQVIPTPLIQDGWGTGYCELFRGKRTVLFCHICHNMDDVDSAFISVGERLRNGPAVYKFTVPLEKHRFFEQVFPIQDIAGYPAYNQVQDFLNGLWYITIVGNDGPESSIRGQLEQTDNFFSLMTTESTFPQAFGPPHRGVTVGTFTKNNPIRKANFDVCHDVVDATYTVIGRGIPKLPGQYVFNFRDVEVPIFGEFQYTFNEEHELFTGYQFTQVYSKDNPQGAIRGQLSQVDPIPAVTVTGRMDANQVGPSDSYARGCILVSYDCPTRTMDYLVFHTVSQAIRLEARAAPPGSKGPVLFAVDGSANTKSPIFGSKRLNTEEEWILYAEQMYFQLYSVNYPEGEIRGQLTTQFDFFTYITGIQMVPPVTTSNLGCGTFNLFNSNFQLDYEIMHSIEDAISVDLYRGSIGETGELITVRHLGPSSSLRTSESPLIGTIEMDDDDQIAFVTRNSFIQIASSRYPEGEIRGQIVRIQPCDPNPLNYTAVSEPFVVSASINSIIELPIRNSGMMLQCSYLFISVLLLLQLMFLTTADV